MVFSGPFGKARTSSWTRFFSCVLVRAPMTLSKVHSNNRRARPLVFASASVEHHLRHRRHHHRRCCDSEYHHCVRCSDKAFESAAQRFVLYGLNFLP